MMWRTPAASRILATAMPAAPRPTISTSRSSILRPVSLSALRRAASTTTAVPCWSSWKTGMSSSCLRRSSISKQRGALMSSRLMPPKVGATALTVATISSGSLVSRHSGKASTPPNSLNSIALPSITGIAARRADVAEPEHGAAVGDDRHRVALDRVLERLVGVVGDRVADAGDAGRVGHRAGRRGCAAGACCAARSCRRRASGTCGRWCRRPRRRRRAPAAATICCAWSVPAASTVMSRSVCASSIAIRSIEPIVPPASPIAVATRPSMPGRWSIRTRRTNENWAWSDAAMRSI